MTKTSKIFLTISITATALSFTEVGSSIGWGILRPMGAVTFILFFFTNLLAKEVTLYDQEESAKREQAVHFGKDSREAVSSPRRNRSSARLETAAAN